MNWLSFAWAVRQVCNCDLDNCVMCVIRGANCAANFYIKGVQDAIFLVLLCQPNATVKSVQVGLFAGLINKGIVFLGRN